MPVAVLGGAFLGMISGHAASRFGLWGALAINGIGGAAVHNDMENRG